MQTKSLKIEMYVNQKLRFPTKKTVGSSWLKF